MQSLIINKILIPFVIDFIQNLMTKDNYQLWLDKLFDFIEDQIQNSQTQFDDKTLLPLVAQLRKLLDVPDLPDN